jgi:glutamate-5-semialdehyde dehydrogenase
MPRPQLGASLGRGENGRRFEGGAAGGARRGSAEILAANSRRCRDRGKAERHSARRCSTAWRSTRNGSTGVASGLEDIADAARPDRPRARRVDAAQRPATSRACAVPLGVIGIIYESRPNVTADAGGLCFKSGNAAILRGGSESFHSSRASWRRCSAASRSRRSCPKRRCSSCRRATAPRSASCSAWPTSIDVIVPRGGRSLIERVQRDSRIPVIAHLEGLCHTYVDGAADPEKARAIVLNAKMRRTGVCGATETLLVDRAGGGGRCCRRSSPICIAAGCEIARRPETLRARSAAACAASEEDWRTEYLDAILAVRVVDGASRRDRPHRALRLAPHRRDRHRRRAVTAERFLREVDSAIVLVNASTQFADGGEFGMGAEIGISTSACRRAGRSAPPSSRATNTSCAATGRCAPEDS